MPGIIRSAVRGLDAVVDQRLRRRLPPRYGNPIGERVVPGARLPTFHTSPHETHRQYVSALTVLLVVVTGEAPQAGHLVGTPTVCLPEIVSYGSRM